MDERFERIECLIGPEKLACLHRAFVAVVGVGAVGSYAVEALARAGVGRLRIIDFDVYCRSNMNRQIPALESTIGHPKVEVVRERILQINPACHVEAIQKFAHVETMDIIFDGPPNVVIDAIDSVNPKIELLSASVRRQITLFTSMGAALRRDPGMIRTGSLKETTVCPLARILRKKLRQRGIDPVMPCVYSIEPLAELPVQSVTEPANNMIGPDHRGRPRRILGSFPTIPGIFGLILANMVIDHILADK